MARIQLTLPLALLSALALASAPSSQCVGHDGLNGPCWQPVDLNLPDLQDIQLPGSGICWQSCNTAVKDPVRVTIPSPVEIVCGQFRTDIRVDTAAGVGVLTGPAVLDYTRTWTEVSPTGEEYQVWRFVTKVDFSRVPGVPAPCWSPVCLGPPVGFDTCFWYGYIDYVQHCGVATGQESAVVLYHACDDFSHNPFFSDRPAPAGGFHPDEFFAIVAPDTPVNPFDPTAVVPPRSGPVFTEAMRNVPDFPGVACIAEERIEQGALQVQGTACLCPLAPSTVQNAKIFFGTGTCPDATGLPSQFASLQIFNLAFGFKWFDLIGTSLGSWTTDFTYPGKEAPFAEEGFFFYHDSCAAVNGLPADTLDLFYGAKTSGGWDAFELNTPAPIPLPTNFLDLASNYSAGFVALPLLGSIRDTDHLIYVNVP